MMIKNLLVIGSLLCGLPLLASGSGEPLLPGGTFVNTDDGACYVVPDDVNVNEFRDPQSSDLQEVTQRLVYCIIGHIQDSDIGPFVARLRDYLSTLELKNIKNVHIALTSKDGGRWAPSFAEFLESLESIPPYRKDDAELAKEVRRLGCDTKNFLDRVHLLPALIDWVETQPRDTKKRAGSTAGKSQTAPAQLEKPVKSPRKPHPVEAWFAKTARWWIGGITVAVAAIVTTAVAYHLWSTKKDTKTTPANGV
jgi:hypothetical protein